MLDICRLTVSHWSVSGEAHGANPWLSSVALDVWLT